MNHASRLRAGVLALVAATALLLPGCKGERDVPAAASTTYLDSFYLLGHSWGGILAIEYALKYQRNLKGLGISNMMAGRVKHGRFLLCPEGNHLALHDDQKVYMNGLIQFIRDVDSGRF